MKAFAQIAAIAALFASAVVADVDPIVIKGSKFFYKTNGTQFYMRGIAYQQGVNSNTSQTELKNYQDPLADVDGCRRDVPLLSELRTNTIRVYAIDPKGNHDECMSMLQDAGIYVIADLSQPGESINRDDPSWNDDLFARYASVVDVMAKYSNTLGFFAGNEVSNKVNNTAASAFVKAAVRDTKAYIKSMDYRPIGVGYATNDDAEIRENLAAYFNCGQDQANAIDFWGYNIYSWCGDSSFQESGYDVRTKEFESYSVPVFFAEYGCNEVKPRQFTDVGTLYGPQMNDVWSGGIVYMYFQEENEFGLVTVDGNTASKLPDFNNLKKQISKVNPQGVDMNDYSPSNTAPARCPAVDSTWGAKDNPLPPAANGELCQCMTSSLECVVNPDTDEKGFEKLFGQVCGYGEDICAGITHNATLGTYGAYSMCNPTEQLSFAFNRYYQSQGKASTACDFGGAANTQQSSSSEGDCGSLMSQAGDDGTGTVTSLPSGAPAPATSTAMADAIAIPAFNFGLLKMGMYLVGALVTGAGIVLM